ncbi:MAG: hypothetical protein EXR72_11760 [Myxococcales bacterium]|nr:hypothetical protein [Myxococcales bacterium]
MTSARIAAKMRKLREDHEDEEMENGELNLVPFLDIVTNVIMFLMMTTSFAAALSDINVSAPTTSAVGSAATDAQPKQDLNLTLQISDKGFIIACAGGVIYQGCSISPTGDFVNCLPGNVLPTLPKVNGAYDYAGLTRMMKQIKGIALAADETKVILNANPEITYEVVVAAMDASRSDGAKVMFPDVLLSAGVN